MTLSRDKVQSCGDNVISQDSHVLYDTVADQSVDKEIINKPSSQARLDDQSEELNICQIQKKSQTYKGMWFRPLSLYVSKERL